MPRLGPFLPTHTLNQPGTTLRSVSQAVEKWLPLFLADPRVTATPLAEVCGRWQVSLLLRGEGVAASLCSQRSLYPTSS